MTMVGVQMTKLEAELGATPVAALVVVADLRIRLHAEPVRHLAILSGLARQLLLDEERLVRRLRAGVRAWSGTGLRVSVLCVIRTGWLVGYNLPLSQMSGDGDGLLRGSKRWWTSVCREVDQRSTNNAMSTGSKSTDTLTAVTGSADRSRIRRRTHKRSDGGG